MLCKYEEDKREREKGKVGKGGRVDIYTLLPTHVVISYRQCYVMPCHAM